MAIVHSITNGLLALGVMGVFIGMFLESAYIPVPSEIILPYAGYLVFLHRATLLEAMLAGLLGGIFGAVFAYWIARYGGRPLIERYGRYVFIHHKQIDRADAWFRRHGDGAVFFGRLLPGIRTYISLPAGVAAMPFGRFLLFSLLGALPWTVLFTYIGFVLGHNWQHIGKLGEYFAGFVLILFVAWLAMLWKSRAKANH
ncbi:DedA family protein [Sulfobacillus thermosulfidooxidans]|uniref:DedA family protein n=1 Tax=Sulfobacillus thermosulfidooxidans TaxID=28034 RepID=UPI0009E9D231|nr:DedA family protein [Sulfobacillus thermosulfidooxidans]